MMPEDYIETPSRKAAMEKALALANDPDAIGETNPKYNIDEFTAFNQEKPSRDPLAYFAKIPLETKAKPKVTAEQLQAFKKQYGADKDLRDYMNKQRGLKRRGVNPTLGGSSEAERSVADKVDYGEVLQSMEQGRSRGRKYASGGSVSSRADGIAQRGKTRGRMC